MDEESITLARGFIDKRAGDFHSAFAEKSYFDLEKSQYQPEKSSLSESSDLGETLSRYQAAATSQHSEFELDFDPLRCTWDDVLRELERAKAATSESEDRGKRLHKRAWRAMGTTGADIFLPALAAIPDNLCVLQGGLAVIFTVCQVFGVFFLIELTDLDLVDCSSTCAESPKNPSSLWRNSQPYHDGNRQG